MAKFNEVQKRRRAAIADRKRATQGDPLTGKLKQKSQPLSISGKRKRKLFNKWRREQKDAVAKGLITMQDVEMAVSEGIALHLFLCLSIIRGVLTLNSMKEIRTIYGY
ncbi:hypothetical protein Acr_25g0003810 [Actinidia rufa]|uniref:Uncharacterized protein n=1 Tax=Actinidia rufa TaxID=165716 RepID=A0A7J0GYU8_9ERIC|nr:hypothetical protein Acr_25g0003810 [Actinidia rufa]